MKIILLFWTVGSLWYGQSARYIHHSTLSPVRSGLIDALLLSTFIVVVLTESLSSFHQLNEKNAGITWGFVAFGCTGWALIQRNQIWLPIRFKWTNFSRFEKHLLLSTAVILGLTLLTGFLYPPNNYDSLTYHMGRIGHWLQQCTIEPFATHIERQIYQPPLAEWGIMHTMLLSGCDGWANSVQWVAGVGCLAALSLLIQEMGGRRDIQLATVFIAVTIPMFILQLSSTQNDIVVSFYLIVSAVYLLQYYRQRKWTSAIWAGLALGFAFLTKGTAYLLSAPILLTWGLLEVGRLFRTNRLNLTGYRSALKLTGVALMLVALSVGLNTGHYSRNLRVYNNPLTSPEEQRSYTNQIHSGKAIVSGISRNVAVHFGFPGVHWVVQRGVEKLHNWLYIDVEDKRTTYQGSQFDLPMLSNNEDNASNFLHLIWLTGSIVWLIRRNKHCNHLPLFVLASTLTVTFIFFCIYLKWQPWHSRLHTTLFLLASPIGAVGLVMTNRTIRWPLWLFLASAGGFVLTNPFRPLLTLVPLTQAVSFLNGRSLNYYVNNRSSFGIHHQITSLLNSKQIDSLRIGLILDENDFDYVWHQQLHPSTLLYHIHVKTHSRLFDDHPSVDYIISTQTWGDTIHYRSRIYSRLRPQSGRTAVFGYHSESSLGKYQPWLN